MVLTREKKIVVLFLTDKLLRLVNNSQANFCWCNGQWWIICFLQAFKVMLGTISGNPNLEGFSSGGQSLPHIDIGR